MREVVFGTSGSTGASKRIVRTEESLRADAAALVAAFPEIWADAPRVVATVRPEHMYGALWRVRAPEAAGSRVEDAVVTSVEELASLACSGEGAILLVTTPSFLEKALAHPDFASLRGRVKDVVTSGSLLRAETSQAVREILGISPFEMYGSTEAGSVAWRRQSAGPEWTLVPGVSATGSREKGLAVDSPFAMERPFVMADAVEFVSPDRFLLLGRLDRRVKILEKYVSLPAVEAAMESHPLVSRVRAESYGSGVARLGALVVLSPAGAAALAKGRCSDLASRLRRDLLEAVGESAFPRRIRFVRELPHNEQGKTTAAAVRNALAAWCAEPAVLSWEESADALAARLSFPPDLSCFKGHFPVFPILPGVAQLYFIRHFARQVFRGYPESCVFKRLKFQKIIVPGEEVSLSVKRRGEGSFEFEIAGPNGRCTSGIVEGAPQ